MSALREAAITVEDLEMRYGDLLVMQGLNFEIKKADVFIIMGGSGCGKSTLLKHMIGLLEPAKGDILYDGKSFFGQPLNERTHMLRHFGVLYQAGALWSSMTLLENVSLPLEQFTELSASEIKEIAALKLALVGLKGFEGYYPSQISGGMRKRAGLARAMALDPEILFFDEPSAGLDPITSKHLDDLILELRDNLGTTIVVVTHELPSLFAIGSDAIFLDAETKTATAQGNPKEMLKNPPNEKVYKFLTRDAQN